MFRFYDCSSSASHLFGISIYGATKSRWWHKTLVKPAWRGVQKLDHRLMKLRFRIVPRLRKHIVDTGLNPGPHSGNNLVLHSCFSILARSIKDEYGSLDQLEASTRTLIAKPYGNNPPDWIDAQIKREIEMATILRWWTFQRPTELRRAKELEEMAHPGGLRLIKRQDAETGLESLVFSSDRDDPEKAREAGELRRKVKTDEQQMLHRLIDIRRYLD